jgi:hypothetical protein
MLIALLGISDGPLNVVVSLLVLFLVVLWLSLIYWTYLDASRRIKDPILVACATTASVFPFLGTIIYAVLRPPEFLADARERALETRAAELRVKQLAEQACPSCEHPIERGYLRCPSCHARLKDPCPSCSQPLDPRWSMCPYCETPVEARRRRSRADESSRRAAPVGKDRAPATSPSRSKRVAGPPGSQDGGKRATKPRSGKRRSGSGRSGGGGETSRPTAAP